MDTLITLLPLVIALVPIGMALRALLTELRPPIESPTAEFYQAHSRAATYPSLATLRDLEDTMPMFVRSGDWHAEDVRAPDGEFRSA